ncbi:MAG: VOC family protein, partial [bacterium]
MIKGIAHLAFQVADMDLAVRFYEKLGFKKKFVLRDDTGKPWIVYLQIGANQFIELFYAHEPLVLRPEITGYQHLCIEVTDIHGVAADLTRKGIAIDHPVTLGLDHNFQCWIRDPDGNRIEL